MLFNSLIPFVAAALTVLARPHLQPGGFWTPGSERAPLAIEKINQEIHPSGPKPAPVSRTLQHVPPSYGNPKIQAIFEREGYALPAVSIEDLPKGMKDTRRARRNLHKKRISNELPLQDVQEVTQQLNEIVDGSAQDFNPIEVQSTWGDLPLQFSTRHTKQRQFSHKGKRSVQPHDYKAVDPSKDDEMPPKESPPSSEGPDKNVTVA